MTPDAVLRVLTGFALVIFLVTAALAVYGFLFTEPGASWKGRCLWRFGLAVVVASTLTAVGTVLAHFVQVVGL